MDAAPIQVRLLLEGGHSETLELAADSAHLTQLFRVLGQRQQGLVEAEHTVFQIPLSGGREALSFSASQLVAVSTTPPIIVEFEEASSAASGSGLGAGVDSGTGLALEPALHAGAARHSPPVVVIDDFLSPYEHSDLLAFALQNKALFDAGTVARGLQAARQNLAVLDFGQQPHSKLVCNRLLTWFPALLGSLAIKPFPIHQVESQLTASNDGHFYRAHLDHDSAAEIERVLTCVYYFSKQPAQFGGGALRIYDSLRGPGIHSQGDSFQQVEPAPNRMVVFPSDSYHELLPVRCPSGRFEDSRFAITNWIWRIDEPDAQARHGWGHMRCGNVPDDWVSSQELRS
ncbi:MAG: 2OG-Fe(II) oxygenase [Congregibacter sp.]